MEILTGIDIVDTERFEQTLGRYRERFARRVFTEKEMATVPNKKRKSFYLAVSFSFKEAIWKSLPEEIQKNCYFRDIEILWHGRKPSVILKGKTSPPDLTIHFYTTGKYAVTTAVFIYP
jgi:holo-[acyl-carrier protein] synthase